MCPVPWGFLVNQDVSSLWRRSWSIQIASSPWRRSWSIAMHSVPGSIYVTSAVPKSLVSLLAWKVTSVMLTDKTYVDILQAMAILKNKSAIIIIYIIFFNELRDLGFCCSPLYSSHIIMANDLKSLHCISVQRNFEGKHLIFILGNWLLKEYLFCL